MTIFKPSRGGNKGAPTCLLPQSYKASRMSQKWGPSVDPLWGSLCFLPYSKCPNYWSNLKSDKKYIAQKLLKLEKGHHQVIMWLTLLPLFFHTPPSSNYNWFWLEKIEEQGPSHPSRLEWGGVLSALGERDTCQEEKDEECRELQGLLAGKGRDRCQKQHIGTLARLCPSGMSRNTGHISVGNKNVSVINDPLGTHGPY